MKVLKFRAWHKELKKMYPVLSMEQINTKHMRTYSSQGDIFSINEIELMQWTGLQDKESRDIYEGDIINNPINTVHGAHNQYGIIRFGEHETSDDYYASGAYGFYIEYLNNVFRSTVDSLPMKDIILLGNIYQNPELMEINL